MTPHDHPPPVRWARAQKRLPLAPKAVLMLVAEQSDCAGDRAQAVKEVDEAIAALTAARPRLTGGAK